MKLSHLLEKTSYVCEQGDIDIEVENLVFDSRKVVKGSVFVCVSGMIRDGHSFAKMAAITGAVALVVEKDIEPIKNVTIIRVDNTRLALAHMSAAYFDYPASKLKTIGITGTKGKTTITYMVHSILEEAGIKTGLIGTIETIIGSEVIPANNTTPESFVIQEYFSRMVEAGCKCVVMEVSSQGLMMDRVAGFTFDYGVFTNIEPDHIGPNEHKDFNDYMSAKSLMFQKCKLGILNIDDEHFEQILKGHTCKIETFGMSEDADLRAVNIDLHSKEGKLGVKFDVTGLMDDTFVLNIPGRFSVYNALTTIAICRHFDISGEVIKTILEHVKIKGRLEPIHISPNFTLLIDYAHNAMSLESLLSTLKEYNPGRLVCMFGCGGNRSKLRRYEMGEISSSLADLTVVTSDNPRFEQPKDIIDDILIGIKKGKGEYVSITDRKEAIRFCIENAQIGDLIVLAGKGHEDYQEIKGIKYQMDERDLIKEILKEMKDEGIKVI
jgi:UDP-N-acetylmuramoyl-L-alanyl-D-glutamate--2,6-diaminopimelate ligase